MGAASSFTRNNSKFIKGFLTISISYLKLAVICYIILWKDEKQMNLSAFSFSGNFISFSSLSHLFFIFILHDKDELGR